MAINKRIAKELKDIHDHENEFYHVEETREEEKYKWNVTFKPPEGSPYHGGKFRLILEFSNDYPFKPPESYFETRIYHYMVSFCEEKKHWIFCNHCLFCAPLSDWSPAQKLKDILDNSFLLLFTDLSFCIDNPQNYALAKLCKENREQFIKNAKEETLKHAI